jgi:hypothetical protein
MHPALFYDQPIKNAAPVFAGAAVFLLGLVEVKILVDDLHSDAGIAGIFAAGDHCADGIAIGVTGEIKGFVPVLIIAVDSGLINIGSFVQEMSLIVIGIKNLKLVNTAVVDLSCHGFQSTVGIVGKIVVAIHNPICIPVKLSADQAALCIIAVVIVYDGIIGALFHSHDVAGLVVGGDNVNFCKKYLTHDDSVDKLSEKGGL